MESGTNDNGGMTWPCLSLAPGVARLKAYREVGIDFLETAVRFIEGWNPWFELIVPVPPSRQRTPQPLSEFANAIGARLSKPINDAAVNKTGDTSSFVPFVPFVPFVRFVFFVGSRGSASVLRPRPAEDAFHAAGVAFVTRVLEERTFRLRHGNRCAPGLRPRRRVIGRELVLDRVVAGTGEALDQMKMLAGASEVCLVRKVDGIDDQRIARPVAARVAHPPPDGSMRTPVHRDDARVMNHLVENHDVVGELDELDVVVVDARQHRRTRDRPQETPLVQAEIFRPLRDAVRTACLCPRRRSSLRVLRLWRHSPVRRI